MTLENRIRVPILMYHDVVPETQLKKLHGERMHYAIGEEKFLEQMKFLKSGGKTGISFAMFYNLLQSDPQELLSGKYVVITFDDCHRSQVEFAVPILKKQGYKASFFVITDWIGSADFASEDDLRELVANGMDVQSHTASHIFLMELNSHQSVRELLGSKKKLESIIRRPVDFLSLPGGRSDRSIWQLAGTYGYKGILTSLFGYGNFQPFWERIHTNGYVPHGYYRIAMSPRMSQSAFENLILMKGWQPMFYWWRNRAATLAKRTIGSKGYHKIWLFLFGGRENPNAADSIKMPKTNLLKKQEVHF